ncbi:type II toxin-antitoxin system RelE family toxin [Deinococcus sp. PEB2-63]
MTQVHQIDFTPKALEMLEAVPDRRERELLLDRIEALATDPELQGKALLGELRGHRSVRAVGQRYRIVYRVLRGEVLVLVIGVGRRQAGNKRDVYEQLERLDPQEREPREL